MTAFIHDTGFPSSPFIHMLQASLLPLANNLYSQKHSYVTNLTANMVYPNCDKTLNIHQTALQNSDKQYHLEGC